MAVDTDLEVREKIQSLAGVDQQLKAEIEEKALGTRAILRLNDEAERHQRNMEVVTAEAIRQLPPSAGVQPMSMDWLEQFFAEVRLVSEEERRLIWARILCLEAVEPGSFSPKTLNTLRLFTSKDAQSLQVVASRTIYLEGSPLGVDFEFLSPDPDPLEDMRRANSLGLISDLRGSETTPVVYPDHLCWTLFAELRGGTRMLFKRHKPGRLGVRTGGYALTDVGRELVRLPEVGVSQDMIRSLTASHSDQFEIQIIENLKPPLGSG